MIDRTMNLFIADSDELMVNGLKQYLDNQFGSSLNITTFTTGESCLANVNSETRFVVLAYFINGSNGREILKLIKGLNPSTEVIMLSSNDDIVTIIEAFRDGTKGFVFRGRNSKGSVTRYLYKAINYPKEFLVASLRVNKYTAVFLVTFIAIGIVVLIAMKIWK